MKNQPLHPRGALALFIVFFLLVLSVANAQPSDPIKKVNDAFAALPLVSPSAVFEDGELPNIIQKAGGEVAFKAKLLEAYYKGNKSSDSLSYFLDEVYGYGLEHGIQVGLLSYVDLLKALNYIKQRKRGLTLALYQKIIDQLTEDDPIYWKAKIYSLRYSKGKEEKLRIGNIIQNNELPSHFNLIEVHSIKQIAIYNLFDDVNYSFILDSYNSFKNLDYPLLQLLYSVSSIYNLRLIYKLDELPKFFDLLEESYSNIELKSNSVEATYFRAKASKARFDNNFNEAVRLQRKVCSMIGVGFENDKPINYESNNDLNVVEEIQSYAVFNLFLGLEGQQRAFDIFFELARTFIKKNSFLSEWDLAWQNNVERSGGGAPQALYVGEYLYQHTGDISYLNRALSLVDAKRGSVAYNQAYRLREIKKGGALGRLMKRDLELARDEFNLNQQTLDATTIDKIIQIDQERSAIREKIRTNYPHYYDGLGHLTEDFIGDQQKAIKGTNTSIVYFANHPNFILRILINEDSVHTDQIYHRVLLKNNLPTLLKEFRECVKEFPGDQKDNRCLGTGSEIYNIIFNDSIAPLLRERLLIVGDGPLSAFPFSALPMDTEGSQFMGTHFQINSNFSMRLHQFMEELAYSPRRSGVLALAPTFELPPSVANQRDADFHAALINSEAEVAAIDALMPGRFLTGDEASRENFMEMAMDYGILHLATHARANNVDGRFSEIALADTTARPFYAAEFTNLALNADMVVLSACETGLGSQHYSEGNIGFNHSLVAAGAKSVVSTHWAIDDQSTAELMNFFYEGLAAGMAKDEALRDAQRKYRQLYAGTVKDHPYYWAAFSLLGDPEPLQSAIFSSPLPWKGIGIALVIIFLGALVFRQRQKHTPFQ